jgi:hypothetical protein
MKIKTAAKQSTHARRIHLMLVHVQLDIVRIGLGGKSVNQFRRSFDANRT